MQIGKTWFIKKEKNYYLVKNINFYQVTFIFGELK